MVLQTGQPFFLTGVIETADEAVETARQLLAVFEEDRTRIRSRGRIAASMLRVHDLLQRQPIIGAGLRASS